ncbi:hypothetical protein V494_08419 [Pseudogymnoascus sp. VKM F-4513 (FW-928)]|nr:hypothetical protein V494_08419 [Pseudogymnoascus sp. VKM F-4513 (FW-928)]
MMSHICGHKSNTYESIRLDGTSQLSIGDTFSTTIIQQAAAPLPVPNQYFNVVLPRTKNFVGRSKELAQLTTDLESGNKVVIAGLGGIGKSQIALEYCYEYRKKYPTSYVWWIDAVKTARIAQAYSDIAETLHLPISSKDNLMRDVRNWFSQPENGQWLLIFDNVDDPEAIFEHTIDGQTGSMIDYLPYNHQAGQIIITSRTKEAADLLGAELIEVDILPNSAARLLIESYLSTTHDNSTSEDVDMLADTLSCIPLALTQASMYLRQMKKTVKEYLIMLKSGEQKAQLLSRHLGSHQNKHSIFTVLNVSYTTLKQKHSLGFEMLNMACWLHRVNIPESVLRQHCQGDKAMSEVEFDKAILPLMQISFLEKQHRASDLDEVMYCIHSLVREVVQIFQSVEDLQDTSKSEALRLIEQETIPLVHTHNWHRLGPWIPHVQSIVWCSNSSTLIKHQARPPLLYLLGTYNATVLSRVDESMEYLEASLPNLQQPGDISNCVTSLASRYQEKANGTSRAIELLRSTLERPEILSAPTDIAVRHEARLRCKLAAVLCEQLPPNPKEAQVEVAKAAELLEQFKIIARGHGHPYEQLLPYMITQCRGEIALAHAAISSSEDVDGLLRGSEFEVLEFCKRLQDTLSPSNVDNNRKGGLLWLLGRVCMAQAARAQSKVRDEKLKEAELSFTTCYNFRRHDSGDLSGWALEALKELAQCLREQRRYHDMEVLLRSLRSSSEIEEQGKTSAKYLNSIGLLSWVLMEQGKWQDAMDVCETFYPSMEKVCGENHHTTVDVGERQAKLKGIIDGKRNMKTMFSWM